MRRLIIDASYQIKRMLHAAKKEVNAFTAEFEGKPEVIGSAADCEQIFYGSLKKTMGLLDFVPSQIILVKDGKAANEKRRKFLPDYKVRPKQAPEFYQEFLKAQEAIEETILAYGGITVEKYGVEADDILAALADVTDGVIWSGDKDLLACKGDVFCDGVTNDTSKILGLRGDRVTVYKSLVGDQSDHVPGCKGFGEKAFIDMLVKFGEDACEDILDMLKNRTLHELQPYIGDFKPFAKIIDNAETVYNSYECVRFHHPGWEGLDWKARYPKGTGLWPEWDLKTRLIEKKDLTPFFIEYLRHQIFLARGGWGYDIETWQDEESLAWGWANKSKQAKGPKLDVFGSHMAGFSLTCGDNSNQCYYFPVEHRDTDNISLDDMTEILNMLPDRDDPVLTWNAEFELPLTRKHCNLRFDRGWLPNVHDAMLYHVYVNENEDNKLKNNSRRYLDYTQVTYAEIMSDDEDETLSKQMNEISGSEVVDYGCDDSVCTKQLASLFEVIMKYEGTWDAFVECEPAPAYLCAEAFLNGIKFDLNRLDELDEENKKQSEELWEKINDRLLNLEWQEGDPIDGQTWTVKMPGCEFLPADDLSAVETKKVFMQVAGEPLKTNLRKIEKIGGLISKRGYPELGDVLTGSQDVDEFNLIAQQLWEPKPELNISSPTQMCNLLYNAMGFPVRLRGKLTDKMRAEGKMQGNPKANESAVRHAIVYGDADAEQKELLELLIKAKSLQTDRSLFLEPYKNMPNPEDGLVHYSTGQSKTVTKRWAPSGPNVAQVSKKSPIRSVYVPYGDDMVWWSFDFSGQELRITAFRSQCEVMLACYPKDGSPAKDVHSMVGIKVASLDGEEYSYDEFREIIKSDDHPLKDKLKEYRSAGKRQVFGSVYGQTEVGLAEKLLISVDRAKEIVAANDAAFPGVTKWKEKTRERLIEDGYATTILGSRRHLNLEGTWKDEHELRGGINSEVQGPAAEMTKLVLRKFWERRIFDRYEAFFHFPVHDQVVGCVSKEDCVEFIREAHSIMTEPFANMDIPVESDIQLGPNFKELVEIGNKFDEEKIKEVIGEAEVVNAA